MEKGTCKHFRGTHHHKTCLVGIDMRKIAGGPDTGWAIRIPCVKELEIRDGKPVPRVSCDRYEEPTAEEIAADEAEWERIAAEFERKLKAVSPLVSKLKRENKGRSNSGVSECPCCKGKLHWAIAGYNGHIRMKCEAEGCIAFME